MLDIVAVKTLTLLQKETKTQYNMETEKTTSAGKSGNSKNNASKTKKGAKRAAEVLGAAALGSASTMAANADWSGEDEENDQEPVSGHKQPEKQEETPETEHQDDVFDPNDIVIDDTEISVDDIVIDAEEIAAIEPDPVTAEITDDDLIVVDVDAPGVSDEQFDPDDIMLDGLPDEVTAETDIDADAGSDNLLDDIIC